MKKYDYLIVGSGLFGATFAYRAKQAGKTCLVIDKRPHLGGNVYCERRTHLPHQQQSRVGFRELVSAFQPLHEQPCCQLPRRVVQSPV